MTVILKKSYISVGVERFFASNFCIFHRVHFFFFAKNHDHSDQIIDFTRALLRKGSLRCFEARFQKSENNRNQCTTVRLCSEGVRKLFPKGFDRQNSIFLHSNGKRKPAPELHLSALNFESSRAIILHFFQEKP